VALNRRRGSWRGFALLAGAVAGLLGPCERPAERNGRYGPPTSTGVPARVLEVTDGDTIVARLESGEVESVRYIGINTPESTPDQPLECFGREASAANERLVGGREVALRFGPERRDDYGRLLAYVQVDRLSVNEALLRRGYARILEIAPNDAHAREFARLEAEAGRAGRGLWSACAG
jgi:micrococcal nuclease